MRSRILATMLAVLLAGASLPARPAGMVPLGVVTQSSGEHFNASKVTPGATVYDGDVLSTEAEGALQLRSGAALLYLPGQSGITVHGIPSGTQAQLRMGTVVFSTAKAGAMEVLADEAFIRPMIDGPTIAQVTVVSPKELQIAARRGALEFSYRGETQKIPEGGSYRIILEPPEPAAKPFPQRVPVKAGRESRAFKITVIVATGWITEWAVHEVLESPDRP
ncbi:MAG TPA: hypothetical protein VH110_05075 [Candidatus Acidoferrum sp.]|nr:hypothetical protein [Candidatus Acidoferrum sp.]